MLEQLYIAMKKKKKINLNTSHYAQKFIDHSPSKMKTIQFLEENIGGKV